MKCRDAFSRVDLDGVGTIPASQLGTALLFVLGQSLTEPELQKIIDELDAEIDFAEVAPRFFVCPA